MLEISKEQINAVRNAPLLSEYVKSCLPDPTVAQKPISSLTDEDWANLSNACLEALTNEAPEVESFVA
jgi:hypothetical protein